MSINDKKEQLLRRIRQTRNIGLVALGLGSSGAAFAQNDVPAADKDPVAKTVNMGVENEGCREFLEIVEVNALSEIHIANRHAAIYDQYNDAIVYTQYKMDGANKFEQDQIDFINNSNHSASTRDHELTHRALAPVSTAMMNGELFTKLSDRARINIFHEVCCAKSQLKAADIKEAIEYFKSKNLTETYAGHYTDHTNYALLAVSAQEKTPEKIAKAFAPSKTYKSMYIDNQEYFANLLTSTDGKYATYSLFTADGDRVKDPAITAKSPVAIGVMLGKDGKEIKTPDGKVAVAQFIRDGRNSFGGYNGTEVYAITNVDKEVQGYSFEKAEQNAEELMRRSAKICGLSDEEFNTLKDFVTGIDLSAHDLSYSTIADLRNNYKDYSLEDMQKRAKDCYNLTAKSAQQKFAQEKLPYLKEVKAVDLVAKNHMNKLNTSAFNQGR